MPVLPPIGPPGATPWATLWANADADVAHRRRKARRARIMVSAAFGFFQSDHEGLEPQRPLGGVEARGGMAEFAVDLEIVGVDLGRLELRHDVRSDRGRKDL